MRFLPNIITVSRIFLGIIIASCLLVEQYRLALYLFILAGISDGLDGFLARRYGWRSRFGEIVDPLADKVLLLLSLIVLSMNGYIPVSLLQLIILRDIWVFTGALAYHYLIGPYELAPNMLSKINTFLQILLVFFVLVNVSIVSVPTNFLYILMYLVFLTNLGSWVMYTTVWGSRAGRAFKIRSQHATTAAQSASA